MFHLLRQRSLPELLRNDLPSGALSFVIAELFYKFHSFMLETGAFLATWYLLGAVVWFVLERRGGPAS